MPSLKSIKKRIVSVKSTRQITKAMKMVSAAKLRRAQENVVAARPYAKKLHEVMQRLAQSQEMDPHPLMVRRETSPRALIILSLPTVVSAAGSMPISARPPNALSVITATTTPMSRS